MKSYIRDWFNEILRERGRCFQLLNFIMKISQSFLFRCKSNLRDPVVDYILILVVLILFLQSVAIVWLMLEYFDRLRISLLDLHTSLRPVTLLKMTLRHSCFPVNSAKFIITFSLQNTPGRLFGLCDIVLYQHFFPFFILHI